MWANENCGWPAQLGGPMRKEKDDQLVVGIRSDNTETKILSDENDI